MMKGTGHTAVILVAVIAVLAVTTSCGQDGSPTVSSLHSGGGGLPAETGSYEDADNWEPTATGFEEQELREAETVGRLTAAIDGPYPVTDLAFRVEDEVLYLDWSYSIPGDLDRDLTVDELDVIALAMNFGETSSWTGGERTSDEADCADANRDGIVGGRDLFAIAVNFGRSVESFEVFRRLNTANFEEGDHVETVEAQMLTPPELPACSHSWTTELGELGINPHNVIVRGIDGGAAADSEVANYPGFTGSITAEGDPQAQVPNFFDFSVEYEGGTAPHEVLWEFGDGFTSDWDELTHDFVSSGPFSPKVTVTDAEGWHLVLEAEVEITPERKVERLCIYADGGLYFVDSDGTNLEWIGDYDVRDFLTLSADSSTIVTATVYQSDKRYLVIDTLSGDCWMIPEEIESGWPASPPSISHDCETMLFLPRNLKDGLFTCSRDGLQINHYFSDVLIRNLIISPQGDRSYATISNNLQFTSYSIIDIDISAGSFQAFLTADSPESIGLVSANVEQENLVYRLKNDEEDTVKYFLYNQDIGESRLIEGFDLPGKISSTVNAVWSQDLSKHLVTTIAYLDDGGWIVYTDNSVSSQRVYDGGIITEISISSDGSKFLITESKTGFDPINAFLVTSDGNEITNLTEMLDFEVTTFAVFPGLPINE